MQKIRNKFTKHNILKGGIFLYVLFSAIFLIFYFGNLRFNLLVSSAYAQGQSEFVNGLFEQLELSPCKQIEIGRGERTFNLISLDCLKTEK